MLASRSRAKDADLPGNLENEIVQGWRVLAQGKIIGWAVRDHLNTLGQVGSAHPNNLDPDRISDLYRSLWLRLSRTCALHQEAFQRRQKTRRQRHQHLRQQIQNSTHS
jgi:hypothetical protein